MSSPKEISASELQPILGQWRQGPPHHEPTSSQHVNALPEQEKSIVITQPATSLTSTLQTRTLKRVQRQDRSLSWNSLFTLVFSADAYKRALYRPAGCWVDVISTTPLASDMAGYIYPGLDEAFVIEASLNNLGENTATKTFAKHYFIVPTSDPLNPAGDYIAEWSEEDFAYIVRSRVKLSNPINCNNGWAFDNFDIYPSGAEEDEYLSTTEDDEPEQTENIISLMQENKKAEECVPSEEEADSTEDSITTDTNGHSPENNNTEDEKADSINSMDELTDATTAKSDSDSSDQKVATDTSKTTGSNEVWKHVPSIESWISSAIGRDWADIDEEDQEENLTSSSYKVSVVNDTYPARPSTPTPFDQDDDPISDLYATSVADETHIIRPSTPTPYDQGDDLDFDECASSVANRIDIVRPSTPTPYDQGDEYEDEDEPIVNLPPVAPSLSAATLAPIQEEYQEESEESSSEAENNCTKIADTLETYENDFWNYVCSAPAGEANPDGHLCFANYQEPSGDYHALSFACYPQTFKSTTPAAVSLWAVSSNNVQHHMHGFSKTSQGKFLGVPFSRQSILTAQACKTINPIHYDGPGDVLAAHVGSALHDAVIGHAHNTFLPIGRHVDEPLDPENPRALHMPTDAHWSILTLPRTYLTAPFIFDYRNPDHALPPGLPGGHGKSRKRAAPLKTSALRNVKVCYDGAEENQVIAATKKIHEVHNNTITPTSSEPSLHHEEDHGSLEPITKQDAYEKDVNKQHENQTLPATPKEADPLPPQVQVSSKPTDTSLNSDLLQKLKAQLKAELKQELIAEIKAELKAELKQELKKEFMQQVKAELKHEAKQDLKLESKPEPVQKLNKTITTRSSGSSFAESIVSSVSWTAAGTALLAVGVVVAVFRGLRK